jgi:hypothetical protein
MIYEILKNIEDTIKAEPFSNTVTVGDLFAVDLTKRTIFPLTHVILNNATHFDNVISFNVSLLFMDLDIGNEINVLNTQFMNALRVIEKLQDVIELVGNPSFEPFTERFENNLTGWAVTFDFRVKNEMTKC